MVVQAQLMTTAEGISFYHQSEEESHWLYNEIFKEICYDTVKLPEEPVIIDAGANIGLFTLCMKKTYPSAQIMAFEPASENFAILQQNLSLHALSGVEAHSCALGSKEGIATLTFFPNTPANATLFSEDKQRYLDLIANEVSQEISDRMSHGAQQSQFPVRRLSDFLSNRQNLSRVDLLKIDVEGGELDIIRGINDKHLSLIQNIVIEIWNSNGELDKAREFLQSKGYAVEAKLVPWKKGRAEMLKMYMVTAQRLSTAQD